MTVDDIEALIMAILTIQVLRLKLLLIPLQHAHRMYENNRQNKKIVPRFRKGLSLYTLLLAPYG